VIQQDKRINQDNRINQESAPGNQSNMEDQRGPKVTGSRTEDRAPGRQLVVREDVLGGSVAAHLEGTKGYLLRKSNIEK
jgi:hypothetical protein